jgi:hypothetical protein
MSATHHHYLHGSSLKNRYNDALKPRNRPHLFRPKITLG